MVIAIIIVMSEDPNPRPTHDQRPKPTITWYPAGQSEFGYPNPDQLWTYTQTQWVLTLIQ